MGSNIRLHPEHGLNPALCTCFWCGESTGEIALLGASYAGKAPMHMVVNYEPCKACMEQFSKGITLIEVTNTPNKPGQPPITGSHYPTGRIAVLSEECIPHIFYEEFAARVLQSRKALLGPDTWAELGLTQ